VIMYRNDPSGIEVARWTGLDWTIEVVHDIL